MFPKFQYHYTFLSKFTYHKLRRVVEKLMITTHPLIFT